MDNRFMIEPLGLYRFALLPHACGRPRSGAFSSQSTRIPDAVSGPHLRNISLN